MPVFCTMSFEKDHRTFTGCSLSAMALTLDGLGVTALGMNCSVGPVEMLPMVEELRKWTNLPLIIKPNAGLPEMVDGRTTYSITREEYVQAMQKIIGAGVQIVGGCCGTDPAYIKALKEGSKGLVPGAREKVCPVAVCSPSQTVVIDRVRPIGERINPTGKKRFQQALKDHDMDYIVAQGLEQTEAGAEILDVNVGLPGLDEKALMVETVQTLQSVLTTPLQLDSSRPGGVGGRASGVLRGAGGKLRKRRAGRDGQNLAAGKKIRRVRGGLDAGRNRHPAQSGGQAGHCPAHCGQRGALWHSQRAGVYRLFDVDRVGRAGNGV